MLTHTPLPSPLASTQMDEAAVAPPDLPRAYRRACRFALKGRYDQARRLFARLRAMGSEHRLQSLIANDLAVVAALEGRLEEAREGWQAALELDAGCLSARLNRDFVEAQVSLGASPAGAAPEPEIRLKAAIFWGRFI